MAIAIADSASKAVRAQVRCRLTLSECNASRKKSQEEKAGYNVELSSHKLLSSEANKSSKSATTS